MAGYSRARDLRKVLPCWPRWLTRDDADTSQEIVQALTERCQALRRQTEAAHYVYDYSKHILALDALRAETERLNELLAERHGEAA